LTEQTFEELTASVKTAVDEIAALKVLVAKKGQDDNDNDDQMEAFLKAQEDMDKEHKEATSDVDEIEKVKEAFRKANDETDEDKKHEAMKKAQEMKEDHDDKMAKKARKGNDDEEPNPTHTVEGTKIANLEKEIALPTINKILQAETAINPTNVEALKKKLKTASLSNIKQMWEERAPYVAALGLENVATPTQTFIPFQAGIIGDDNPETDFAKMDSEKLLSEMYR